MWGAVVSFYVDAAALSVVNTCCAFDARTCVCAHVDYSAAQACRAGCKGGLSWEGVRRGVDPISQCGVCCCCVLSMSLVSAISWAVLQCLCSNLPSQTLGRRFPAQCWAVSQA